ncbi:hypothetical protein SUBVAR_07287 [Subdoligranulum variabile DSM 15176]|uniref:Uncharacterized protein n=1 Tax=Subdoligranulum variabile DSM 15176 TaxID=411471 RepID=D1PSA4_9FIRM|nr:hypothetical protein SUBVAR_07287 [Subdoligranulum variabile DSM 15176]
MREKRKTRFRRKARFFSLRGRGNGAISTKLTQYFQHFVTIGAYNSDKTVYARGIQVRRAAKGGDYFL